MRRKPFAVINMFAKRKRRKLQTLDSWNNKARKARNYIKYSVISSRRRNSSENFQSFFVSSFSLPVPPPPVEKFLVLRWNATTATEWEQERKKTFPFSERRGKERKKTFAKDFRWNFFFSARSSRSEATFNINSFHSLIPQPPSSGVS